MPAAKYAKWTIRITEDSDLPVEGGMALARLQIDEYGSLKEARQVARAFMKIYPSAVLEIVRTSYYPQKPRVVVLRV